MIAAAARGQSLVKLAVVDSVEYSRTLLRRRLDLTATLSHDPSAAWSGGGSWIILAANLWLLMRSFGKF